MTSATAMAKPSLAGPAYRLDLTIGQTTYAIQPIAAARSVASRAFRLTKGDGTAYDVAQTSFGAQCDCPDYIFRRDGLDPSGCKHIKALVGSGLLAVEAR